jgi:four helix bundle protein
MGPAAKDFKFRDQIRDSPSSVTSNIAEGFGRYRPAEFGRFLNIARGPLTEIHNRCAMGTTAGTSRKSTPIGCSAWQDGPARPQRD